jgi:hypothetical protein
MRQIQMFSNTYCNVWCTEEAASMNIHEQFEEFLAKLGVEMERPEEQPFKKERYNGEALPEVSIFQASRDHYGVFYRLDIVEQRPELRIMVPTERGETKMNIYLVRLSDMMPMAACFADMDVYEGSDAYERGREATLQHLLYATAEMMKQLFWAGDLESQTFPPEIEVHALLQQDQLKLQG